MSEEKNKYNKAYDEGYNQGKKDDFLGNFSQNLVKGIKTPDDNERQSYNTGYEDGSSDKHDDSNSNYSGGTSGSNSSCFISTACMTSKGLPDDCNELEVLRKFRDTYVAALPNGKKLLEQYYQNAPQIVTAINKNENAKEIYDALYAEVSNSVKLILNDDNKGAFENYCRVVESLSDKFVFTN